VKVPGGTRSWGTSRSMRCGGTNNPPPESKTNITLEQLVPGAIVQFEASGALHHRKVKTC
jgi:hypothetical protein